MSEEKNSQTTTDYPKAGFEAWYMVFILFLAYTFSAIDRQILTLLVKPIRADLGLSDSEISLLMGFAFAFLFALAGLPIGRLSDRKSRRWVISIGISVWCVMTAVSGFAKSFWHLFIARMGVGVGEASLTPAALSLISDRFPPNKRALALSVYHLGYPVGAGIAMIVGGLIIGKLTEIGDIQLGILGTFKPWQMTFIVVGLPGLVLALLMFTFTEPARQGRLNNSNDKLPLKDLFAFLKTRKEVYSAHFIGVGLLGLLAIGTAIWYPTFLIRTYDLSIREAGMYFGAVNLLFGAPGLIFGGWLAGKLASKGYQDANMRIMIIATATKTLPLVLAPLMPSWELAIGMTAIATFCGQMSNGVSSATLLDITPNEMRAQVASILLLIVNIIGIGFGATFIALLTDYVFGSDEDLRYSIALASAVVAPIAIIIFCFALKPYKAAVIEAQKWQ